MRIVAAWPHYITLYQEYYIILYREYYIILYQERDEAGRRRPGGRALANIRQPHQPHRSSIKAAAPQQRQLLRVVKASSTHPGLGP